MLPQMLLGRTCRIRPYLREAAGEALFGEWEERRCRAESAPSWKTVAVHTGGVVEQVPVRCVLFLNGSAVPVKSEIEIAGVRMRVLSCAPMWGITQSHVEVEAG